MRPGQSSCGLLAQDCLHEDQALERCTGIPVLVHWVAFALLCMAAVGFALCVCVCVCVLARTIVHASVSHMCVFVFECVYFLVVMFYSYVCNVHEYITLYEYNALTPLLRQSSLATILYSCEVINDWYEATTINIWRLYCKLIPLCVCIQFQVATL